MRSGRKELARAITVFSGHRIAPRKSLSWHLNSVDENGRYQSAYAYAVTWTPGTLVVSGDLGEFIVTHYHAMPTIKQTIQWLDGISYDYLMNKSSAKRVFDRDRTCADILFWANAAARPSLKAHLEDVAAWGEDGCKGPRPVLRCEPTGERDYCRHRPKHVVPYGWELWAALYDELEDRVDCGGLGLDCIFTVKGRREVKHALREHLDGAGQESCAALCRDLGLDDYYGAQTYPPESDFWYAAVQRWVQLVKPTMTVKESADV